jgi:ATP synthase F1 complex assembly factor 1
LQESPERIKEIWTQHHAEQPLTVSTVLEATAGRELISRATKNPMFVLPVFRKDGFFNLLSQWQDKSFLLTFLEEYKKNPSAAQPWMCLTVYEDLAFEKQLSLVRGDFTPHLTKADAEIVQKQLIACYMNNELFTWVNTFNTRPQDFDFQTFMDRYCRPFWPAPK